MSYTKYDDVNEVLEKLVGGVQKILGDNLIGIYLHGSLALGDFDLANSDVDFMVVIKNKLTDAQIDRIEKMHNDLIADENGWGKKLEGSYLTQEQLKSFEPPFEPRPYLNEKDFYRAADYGQEWILEKYAVRECGITLFGPDPKELIERVEVDDVVVAVKNIFQENWLPMLTNPQKLENDWYQPYAILTLCRVMYVTEKGKMGSKQEAAAWALDNFGDRWGDLLELARHWQRGEKFERINDVLQFLQFVKDYLKF